MSNFPPISKDAMGESFEQLDELLAIPGTNARYMG